MFDPEKVDRQHLVEGYDWVRASDYDQLLALYREALAARPCLLRPQVFAGRKGATMSDAEDILNAAVQKIVGAALAAIQADPHQWSTRPCETCRAVTAITGIKFGCDKYRESKE